MSLDRALALLVFASGLLLLGKLLLFPARSKPPRRFWKKRGVTMRRPAFVQTNSGGTPASSASHGTRASADQLVAVMAADFERVRLLNRGEERVFLAAEEIVRRNGYPWRVMAQVSLGEILRSEAYTTINSKRVDFLIVDQNWMPVSAIEFQGAGHHQHNAAARDAVKKEALRRAGVGYIELFDGDRPGHLDWELRRLADRLGIPATTAAPSAILEGSSGPGC